MKEALLTSLRHALTALAGLGGFLLSHGAISPDDAAAVDAAGAGMGDALAAIAAALLARLVIWISGKIMTGGAASVLCMCVIGSLSAGGLSGCAGDYPLTASVTFRDAESGAKAGLSYAPTVRIRGQIDNDGK